MYQRPTAPANIGGVLDDVVRLYRASFARCWLLSLVSVIASTGATLIVHGGSFGLTSGGGDASGGDDAWSKFLSEIRVSHEQALAFFHTPRLWGSYLALIAVSLWLQTAMMYAVAGVATGQVRPISANLQAGLRASPRVLVAGIVFLLALLIGLVLLVIPGIYLWGMLQLFMVALVVENLGPFAALGRSWMLVSGAWWRTSAIFTIVIILYAVALVIVGMLWAMILGALIALAHFDATTINLASTLVGALYDVFLVPLLLAAMASIYFDLRLRRDGGDLAARVAALGSA